MKKILFITQDLNRTGSEMVLWYLLTNLDSDKYAISVFCIRKGELFDLLPKYVEKYVMYRNSPRWSERMRRRILKFFGKHPLKFQLDEIQKKINADIWFVNTVAVPEIFELDKHPRIKIVTYIHEYLYAFSSIKRMTLERIISYSDICIGCSEMVCEKIANLKAEVMLQHSFIDTEEIRVNELNVQAIKEKLGILPTDFVWVVSGGTHYMKGFDLVLPLLEHFKDESVKILWLGSKLDNGLEYYVRSVAEQKYPNRLMLVGAQSAEYYDYMSVANGLLLLSREETFSLVMIEAAYLGLPIVAFDIGIAKTFIKEDMGIVVHDRSIESFVEGMSTIHNGTAINTTELREEAMKYSVEQQLPIFTAVLDNIFEKLAPLSKD